jgi:restriction system protein
MAVIVTIAVPPIGPVLFLALIGCGGFVVRAHRRGKAMQTMMLRPGGGFERLTAQQFEHALADLCRRDGCSRVTVVGGAGDLGADVLATTPDGRRMVIQAKRYAPTNKVGSPEIQKVGGTFRVVHHAQLAAVVTTSQFTPAAIGYARQAGIRLFGGGDLARWASRTGPAPWQ